MRYINLSREQVAELRKEKKINILVDDVITTLHYEFDPKEFWAWEEKHVVVGKSEGGTLTAHASTQYI